MRTFPLSLLITVAFPLRFGAAPAAPQPAGVKGPVTLVLEKGDQVREEAPIDIYLIVIGKTATGYSVHCPDVLGCAAVGKTVEGVIAKMKKALEFHFEGMVEDSDPIPKPRGVDSYREVTRDVEVDHYFLAHVQIDTSRFAAPVSPS